MNRVVLLVLCGPNGAPRISLHPLGCLSTYRAMKTTIEAMAHVGEKNKSEAETAMLTLADLLPMAAVAFEDRPAVVGTDRTYSFSDADRAAAAVAGALFAAGVRSGDHVVLSMHKTVDSFIIIHGLLRIGAVVVPLDPLMPVASATALIALAAPSALVVDSASAERLDLAGVDVAVWSIDGDGPNSLRPVIDGPGEHGSGPDVTVAPGDPAYVIFTSGSTGVPKGITHTHRSAMAYAQLAVDVHGITADDRLAGLPPLHFDMSTLELYAAPFAGASIVPIGTAELRFPASFTERAAGEGITVWYSVPFQLRQISERGALDQRDMSSLRHIIYAGEAFSAPALAALMGQLPGVRFSNAYGPAETNVVTVHELDAPPTNAVPIGQPWGDVAVAIVDPATGATAPDELISVADGTQGELWVKADSTMVGYLQRPDLDAERLIGTPENRWYRTGDLVTRDELGVLWLAGRIDHQIKVRGTRLELEAIESVLATNPQVADAVVAPDLSGSSIEQLIAAVTLTSDTTALDERSLRRWCAAQLAAVAIPANTVVWDSFPLTSSGKVDRSRVRSSLNDARQEPTGRSIDEPATNGTPHD